jgi:hypothetical protein
MTTKNNAADMTYLEVIPHSQTAADTVGKAHIANGACFQMGDASNHLIAEILITYEILTIFCGL